MSTMMTDTDILDAELVIEDDFETETGTGCSCGMQG